MTDHEIAFQALKDLSGCKYLYDDYVVGAIKAVFHQRSLGECTPERLENIEAIVVKGLKQIFPLNKEGKPHDDQNHKKV